MYTDSSSGIDSDDLCEAWITSHFPPLHQFSDSPSLPNFNLPTQGAPSRSIRFPQSDRSGSYAAESSGSHGDPSKTPRAPWTTPASPFGLPQTDSGWTGAPYDGGSHGAAPVSRASEPAEKAAGLYATKVRTLSHPGSSKRHTSSRSDSPEKASTTHSDSRRKRIHLSRQDPRGVFGIPLPTKNPGPAGTLTVIPKWVQGVINHFSTGRMEVQCVPQSPEIDSLLSDSFAHEYFPAHSRFPVPAADQHLALTFTKFAIHMHIRAMTSASSSLDESTWYPIVRRLLSIEPPEAPCTIPTIPDPDIDDHYAFIQTIDATTKLTTAAVPPLVNIKLDALLALNTSGDPHVQRAVGRGVRLNAFLEPSLEDHIVALGVEVKASGCAMDAEYQIAVWGMKTLNLTAQIAGLYQRCERAPWEEERMCNLAVGLTVCGHVWSYMLTYKAPDGALVTHGPVLVGGTDTLYGTCKVLKWVGVFRRWVVDRAWPDWRELLEGAMQEDEDEEGGGL